MTEFEDHFSRLAREYARYRPGYPAALFAYLASLPAARGLAWDCGTGNGQAALQLVEHFERVVATDASPEQLAEASPHPRIDYRAETAEGASLAAASVDLVTVAVAVHWFDLDRFYATVRRVAAPGGILAVWTYQFSLIEPAIDRLLERYYYEVLAGYWPERVHYLEERYRTLPFPFPELDPPDFEIQADWDLERLAGFVGSWSASRRYLQERGKHPLEEIWGELTAAWGDDGRLRRIRWPLHLRVGRAA